MPVHPLVERGILRAYPLCPICGGTERAAVRRRPPMDDVYVEAAAENIGVSLAELHEALEIHACAACGTVWCDPWFSAAGLNHLYTCGATQHLYGWQLFYESMSEGVKPHRVKIWSALRERLGPIATYGEMNCPFMGLLPLLRDLEAGPRDRQAVAAETIARIRGRHWFPNRGVSVFARAWRRLRRSRVRLRPRVLDAPGAARVSRLLPGSRGGFPPAGEAAPARRFLVVEPSSAFWMASCTSIGVSCRALAPTAVLRSPVIDWTDAEREALRFDLLGLFNCLDHFLEPRAVLHKALERADAVFIEVHRSGENDTFSRQHLFALGPRALEHLLPAGWTAENWSERIGDVLQDYYLVVRKCGA